MLKTGTDYHSLDFERNVNGSTLDKGSLRLAMPWFRNGVDNPFYKQLIQDNKDATTALTAQKVSVKSFRQGYYSGIYRFNNRPVFSSRCGFQYPDPGNPLSIPILTVQRAQAQARSHAFDKVRKLQTPFQLGVFGGELREVIQLLRNPLAQSIQLTKDLVRAKALLRNSFPTQAAYKAAKAGKSTRYVDNIVKSMSDLWLQYRFGILPLISDINDILALAADKSEEVLRTKGRTYGASEYSTSSVTFPFLDMGTTGTLNTNIVYKAECFIHFGLLYDRLNRHEEFSGRILDNFDSFEEVAITAWELIPFSFLVDYFVNIGDIINASVTTDCMMSYTSESTVRTIISQHSWSDIVAYPNGSNTTDKLLIKSIPHITLQNRHVTRVGGILAIPPLSFSLPGSNIRYMNIAALAASLNIRRS